MLEPKISLMIYGTRQANSGWEPLIFINKPPFPQLSNIRLPGLGKNPYYYTFRIDKDYTLFTLVYNPQNIKAAEAGRDGALKVAFSIPRGYILDNGANPFNLFIDLQRTLENELLTKVPGTDNVFRFKPDTPNVKVFQDLLDSFKLRPSDTPHRTMSATGSQVPLILADDSKAEKLFEDVQFAEFAPYKEIAVAKYGEAEVVLTDLEIPRKPRYEIYVNSQIYTPQLKPYYNYGYSDTILIDCLKYFGLSPRAYEPKILEFTINDALAGKYAESVIIDRMREVINVTVDMPKKLRKKFLLRLEGSSDPKLMDRTVIKVNGRDRNVGHDNSIELIGEELVGTTVVDFNIIGEDYVKNGQPRLDGNTIYLPVKKVEVRKSEITGEGIGGGGTTGGNRRDLTDGENSGLRREESKKNDLIHISVSLQETNSIHNLDNSYSIKFSSEEHSFSQKLKFNKIKKDGAYAAKMVIPAEWGGNYELTFSTDAVKYIGKRNFYLNASRQVNEILIDGTDTRPLTWRDNKKSTLKWLMPLIYCLLYTAAVSVIAILIYAGVEHHHDKDRENHEQQNQNFFKRFKTEEGGNQGTDKPTAGDVGKPGNPGEDKSGLTVEEATKQLQDFNNEINDENLSFDQIRQINYWLEKNSAIVDQISEGKELKKHIALYMKLMAVIENQENRSLDNIETVYKQNNKLADINSKHKKYIENLWMIPGQNVLSPNQRKKVNERLKKDGTYRSFMMIPAAADIVKTQKNNPRSSIPPSTTTTEESPTGDER